MTVQNIVLLKFAKFIQRSIKNIPTVFLKWDIIWSADLETREAHIHPNHIQVTPPPRFLRQASSYRTGLYIWKAYSVLKG